jgi:hypothetical protein
MSLAPCGLPIHDQTLSRLKWRNRLLTAAHIAAIAYVVAYATWAVTR